MPTHAMSKDRDALWIQKLELFKELFWQLLVHVRLHIVSRIPRLPRCVDVEPRTGAKVP